MIKNRYINVICIFIVIVTLSVSVLFMYSPNFGVVKSQKTPEYATLFSTDKVHEIDIQINESTWNDMLENAINEEYVQANVVIDGQTVSGIGIRPKGNSSLSTIVRSDSDRYSFKVEFDHYSNKINYKGLDMLVLNNISQDNTYMKDYVCYQMMNEMGAIAPLSSFINVKVNGEDWGLYLAAEGIGESFAQRVYGNNFGEIYKPDTDEMGAEKIGNQVNNIDAEKIGNQANNKESTINKPDVDGQQPANIEGGMPDMSKFVDENGKVDMQKAMEAAQNGGLGKDMKEMATGGARGGFGGRNSSVTSLVYVDDDSDSYSAIFDNAVFNTSNADKKRLITAIKKLNEREDIENVVDVDEVIRYFVVHNFVLNSDSYTGSIIHNYYLSEKDGQLS
ncbi:MAG: CotH kinase family protein, partial [Clostridioides sp.]|nr:CotH kinase family protein [Clostridioides sp.]